MNITFTGIYGGIVGKRIVDEDTDLLKVFIKLNNEGANDLDELNYLTSKRFPKPPGQDYFELESVYYKGFAKPMPDNPLIALNGVILNPAEKENLPIMIKLHKLMQTGLDSMSLSNRKGENFVTGVMKRLENYSNVFDMADIYSKKLTKILKK